MSEVSCRAYSWFVAAEQAGVLRIDELLEGLPLSRAFLEDESNRVPWELWATMCDRAAAAMGSEKAVLESGRFIFTEGISSFLRRPAALFTDDRLLYRVMATWGIPSLYRAVAVEFIDVDVDHVRVVISMRPGFRASRAWFLMAGAALPLAPRFVGRQDGKVVAEIGESSATFHVTMPPSSTFASRLRGFFSSIGSPSAVAEELGNQQAELELKRAELKRAEATFHALTEELPDLVLRVDADLTLLDLQGGSGFHQRELIKSLIGTSLAPVLDLVPDISRPRFEGIVASFRESLASGRRRQDDLELDGPGGHRVYEARFVPIGGGVKKEALVLVRNVTEQRLTARKLAITERMASLGTLAATVAHEMNNPLTYVGINAQLISDGLQESAPDVADLRQLASEVIEGTTRVVDLVEALRTFSRVEVAASHGGAVDVNAVLDQALVLVGPQLKRAARFERHGGETPLVQGDASRLAQVFVNLLANAAQATEGVRDGVVRATTRRLGDVVEVAIEDTGTGLSELAMRRLFEPFFTTKPAGKGTGLGLAVCKEIVDALGGTIGAENLPTGGARFWVRLPLATTVAPAPRQTPLETKQPRRRVLVIDDEPLVGNALARSLQQHEVVVAAGGRAGLEQLERDQAFDVILCDLTMPEVDGVDVYEALRSKRPELAARVVIITGGALTARASAFLESHRLPVLGKPVDRDALARVVSGLE
ncbi:MAG: ATP-binding protein [Myxococcales bacterium]|nr:ATP-binding protein [Myxococcales bacterium]